jgi:hypothetical protein
MALRVEWLNGVIPLLTEHRGHLSKGFIQKDNIVLQIFHLKNQYRELCV